MSLDRKKRTVWRWVLAGVVAVVLLVLLGRLRPAAPRTVDLLTGPEGSTYHELGLRYAKAIRSRGIQANVVVTKGALDNLRRISAADTPTIGFAQTGVEMELDDPAEVASLVSLGSLGYEPIWVFAREDGDIHSIADLAGAKVALGARGTGTRAMAKRLLAINDLTDRVETAPFDDYDAATTDEALQSGAIDAAFLVSSVGSKRVGQLLASRSIRALPFDRAEAYAARYPELARLVIPMGTIDLGLNIPDEDLELVSGTTNLVAREDLHDAAVALLLGAARGIRRQSALTAPSSRFPSMDHTSLPLSDAAVRYFEDGPSGLSRILPYWLAAIADQLIFVVLPALLGLLAVLKTVPTLLNLRFSYYSTKLYRRLAVVENRADDAAAQAELLEELDRIDAESRVLKPTLSKLAPYFEFRQNLHDVRDRVQEPEGLRTRP